MTRNEVELEQRLPLDGTPVVAESAPFSTDASFVEIDAGPTLYVSTSGSNSNDGASPQQAFRTIREAVQHTTPGTTILVMPGVYTEHVISPKGGTSWDSVVRIAAYDPSNRPVIRPNAGEPRAFTFAHEDSRYIELDGLVIDGANASYEAIKITSGSFGASSHIRVKNSEIKNGTRWGVLITGAAEGVGYNVFSNVDVHSNGSSRLDHGFYISTPNNLVENSYIHDNSGWGIHNYGGNPSHNVYRNNRVEDNDGARDGGVGIGVYMGTDVEVYGNTVTGSNYAGIMVNYGARNAVVRDNTVYGNKVIGIGVGSSAGLSELDGNLIYNQPLNVQILSSAEVEFGSVDPYDAIAGGSSTAGCYNEVTVQSSQVEYFIHCGSGSNVLASFASDVPADPDAFDPPPFQTADPSEADNAALDELMSDNDVEVRELIAVAAAMLHDWGVVHAGQFMSNLNDEAFSTLLSVAAVEDDLERILADSHAEVDPQGAA